MGANQNIAWDDYGIETVLCPACGERQPADAAALDTRGQLTHFRCRFCGRHWSAGSNLTDSGEDGADDWHIVSPVRTSGWYPVYSPSRKAQGRAYYSVCGGAPRRASDVQRTD
jgi:hypothetical protein